MTFPERLHEIIQNPQVETKVLDLIRDECLKEYMGWRDAKLPKDADPIEAGGIGASANLLCAFMGLTKEEH